MTVQLGRGTVTRYVITHSRGGLRQLTEPMQGRYTYATAEEAQAKLDPLMGPDGLIRVLTADEVHSLEVRPCECWAGHFDPVGHYFDQEIPR